MQIKDKAVIITGGANGIGAALARRLVLESAQVVIGDIDKKSGQDLVTELNQKYLNLESFVSIHPITYHFSSYTI
ncbi:hypothetical protein C2G38_1591584 [Gigaspora rosea]|uniref:Uncharacterized protein n=1 Tax=Gigaspora rosea TaxID=44941 RepID=A0A397UYN9_9GLOM|nr:hypothetical protein C2G38_1591584 [Gigaspora rosea]